MTQTITDKIKAATGQNDQSSQSGEGGQGGNGKSALSGVTSQLPLDRLKDEAKGFGQAFVQQGLSRVTHGVESLTGKLNDYAEGGAAGAVPKMAKNMAEGDSPAKAGVKAMASKTKDKVKEKLSGITGGGGGGQKLKVTNILEYVDVPVPRDVAYEQWTKFEDFPTFMKKVENVNQEEDEKLKWRAQIFWSHRSWDAEIVDQVPNERIVWKSDGEKGHVDGAVTFHELTPDLTRVQVVLEYHPKGLFEHTGNLWRAQGRRARLELKHYARHVSTRTILHQDEVDGWKGEIHDGHVVEGKGDSDQQSGEDSGEQGGQPQRRQEKQGRQQDEQAQGKKQSGEKQSGRQSGEKQSAEKQSGQGQGPARKPRKSAPKVSKTAAARRPRRATSKASAG